MFDGRSFRSVANALSHETSEESLRTSIGRSYYSAFWGARSYAIQAVGLANATRFQQRGAHTEVIRFYEQSRDQALRRLRHDLRDLIDARHSADYDERYAPINIDMARDAQLMVSLSQGVCDALDQIAQAKGTLPGR